MKTTAKHFEYFRKRCLYWADKFGLDEWDIRFAHKDRTDDGEKVSDALAFICPQYLGCVATVNLNPDWSKDIPTETALDFSAKHEMVHLLVHNVMALTKARFITEDEVNKAEETLVVKLCKLL